MTQIVGIICKQSIIVACESQYTLGRRKVTDAQKISGIKFKNFEGALVAAALREVATVDAHTASARFSL
jgi:hypothetical protein